MRLDVSPIADADAIDAILRHPAIAPKIRHDAREPGYIDNPAVTYYGAYVDGALSGAFAAVRFSPWETEVHAAILPDAVIQSRVLGLMFLAEVFGDPALTRATAYVLATLPSAANYCRKLGFIDEGRRRDACRVGGLITDVLVLGLKRVEFQRLQYSRTC